MTPGHPYVSFLDMYNAIPTDQPLSPDAVQLAKLVMMFIYTEPAELDRPMTTMAEAFSVIEDAVIARDEFHQKHGF